MLLCEHFLLNVLHVAKISRSRVPYLYFQKLWLINPKMFNARREANLASLGLFSSAYRRTFMNRCYSMRNCHSFVQEVTPPKTSDVEQKQFVQKTSQDELKQQDADEKVKIYFETAKGEIIECLACTNQNVMNASIENDIAMHGNCGGEAICSVCHVNIDEKYQEFMPKISEEEAEMLDMIPKVQDNSRLSCQIIVRKELEGAVFKLPHYEGPSYENPN